MTMNEFATGAEAVGDPADNFIVEHDPTHRLPWAVLMRSKPALVVARFGAEREAKALCEQLVACVAAAVDVNSPSSGRELARLQAAYDELDAEHGALCEDIEEHLGSYSCDREGNEAYSSEVVRFVGEDLRVMARAILPGSTQADRESASAIAADVLRGDGRCDECGQPPDACYCAEDAEPKDAR